MPLENQLSMKENRKKIYYWTKLAKQVFLLHLLLHNVSFVVKKGWTAIKYLQLHINHITIVIYHTLRNCMS